MRELLEIAAARRAEIDAELREIDAFLDFAEDLFGPNRPEAGATASRDDWGSNVIPFPRHPRVGGESATAYGLGA